ncbi:MAG: carboxypeptidase-like regulatory domain-containing protein [Bacteroidales bacterium]|jgi:hypothetical protein|nr:carboxypeptidase-like regulatory domain-containing protein [Bacteroidales bacterium]
MKRWFVILLALFILTCHGFSQGSVRKGGMILFHGLVMDAKTESPLAGSQVIINRSFASVSNGEGKFALYVNRSDTVVFSRLGYKSAMLFVSDTLAGKEFIAGIYLHADTVSIGEVIIVPRLTNLKSDLLRPRAEASTDVEYAKYNMAVSAYQGRMTSNKTGDPSVNYEIIRQQQRNDAYSKGQIPSDRIVGISPLLLVPAAYMLMNGLPGKPEPLQPHLTEQEVNQIHRKFLEKLKQGR